MEEPPEVMGLPAGSLEDKDLTLAYQRGEDGAYQAIYDRYSNRVHGVCRRMLGNNQDAQDAAQESFLRVYQALGRFNGRYQLGPWITRIATNVCLDHIRAKSRRPKDLVPLEIVELEAHEEIEADGPDDIVIRKSESRRVRKVLESLPPMHRAAIVLRDFEGLSYQEVAIALGVTDCQVKALIHRARQGFKRSWTSVALRALVPVGLFPRLRKLHTPKSNGSQATSIHHVAESLTASAAPAASSCSAAFSQCGQFVADKFAPALTAVALGAASLVMPGETQAPARGPVSVATDEAADVLPLSLSRDSAPKVQASPRTTQRAVVQHDDSGSDVRLAEGSSEQPAPAASPAPAATPTAASSPSPAPPAAPPPVSSSDGGSSGSAPSPAKTPFTAAVGFESAGNQTVPIAHEFRLGCVARYFEQTLTTRISHDGTSYDSTLYIAAAAGDARLRLTIQKGSRTYEYLSWGNPPVATWTVGDKTGDLSMSGEYGPRYGDEPEAAGFPGAGTFQVQLTIDCSGSPSPTTESVVFTTR